jgi:outer membrane protein assembly factor BamB
VFAATGTGELTAYSRRDGGTLWSVRLAEVVKQIFEVDEETVQVLLTDGQLVHLGLERGSVMAAPESSAEREDALPDANGRKSRSGVRVERFSGSRTFGDVDANLLAIAEDGSFQVAMGKRRKGTPTPMLIRYEGVVKFGSRGELEELWRTPVPGVEPMKARAPMALDAHLHASSAFVCAAYSTLDKIGVTPSRLAAFDIQDGRRLWDHPIPEGSQFISVTVSGVRIYLVTWSGLTVMDAASGDTLFAIDELPFE